MTWARLKNGFNRVYVGADYYLGSYARAVGGRLTQIAAAVYECQPIKHFRQGFGQIFHLPEFLHIGEQTRALVVRSANTNFLQYLLPVILYRRSMNIIYKKSPDALDSIFNWLDWGITLTLIMRLYLRRLVNNTAYNIAYPRVVAKDVEKHLPFLLAEQLAKELAEMFDKIFLHGIKTESFFRENLFPELHSLFTPFFKREDINAKSFSELSKSLSEILAKAINTQEFVSNNTAFIHDFSAQLARIIANEFAQAFGINNTTEKKPPEALLLEVLEKSFYKETAAKHFAELQRRVSLVKTNVQSFLPVVHHPACHCKDVMKDPATGLNTPEYYKRTIHAGISSPFYYAGNIAFTYLPDLLSWRKLITADEFFYAQIIAVIVRILIAGQAQNEYKAAKRSQCTRHRYQLFSRNKAHSFGVGAAQEAVAALLARFFYVVTGVDNFFTRDAINQFVIQMNSITTLAHNDPLPGTKKNVWNLFYLPQKVTRWLVDMISWLFLPDPRETDARDKLFEQIRQVANSNILHTSVRLVLGPGMVYPQMTAPNSDKARTGKNDALILLFKNESIRFVLQLYYEDIQSNVSTMKKLHKLSTWIAAPVLALPIPAAAASLLAMPLRLLKEESLAALLDKIKIQLMDVKMNVDLKVQVIEKTVEVPSMMNPLVVSESKASTVHTSSSLETDIQAAMMEELPEASFDDVVSSKVTDSTVPRTLQVMGGNNPKERDSFEWIEQKNDRSSWEQASQWSASKLNQVGQSFRSTFYHNKPSSANNSTASSDDIELKVIGVRRICPP